MSLFVFFFLPVSPSSGVSMAPAFPSTLTPTPAAASRVIPGFCVMSRTRMGPTPAVCPSVNTGSAGCPAWARPTASVTAASQERRVTEVRKRTRVLPAFACGSKNPSKADFSRERDFSSSVCVSNHGHISASNLLLFQLSLS